MPKTKKTNTSVKATPAPETKTAPAATELSPRGKSALMVVMLSRAEGATLAEMAAELGWKENSIRGAMSTLAKKKVMTLTSEIRDGKRHYKATVI